MKELPETMQALHLNWYIIYESISIGFEWFVYNTPEHSPEDKKKLFRQSPYKREYITFLPELL